jgi:TolB-like protein/Flp pilus assembly protein TadD
MRESETFIFGPFSLSVDRRELRWRGELVELGSRAFDLLVALARRGGQLATKSELMEEVWPDTVVEENNLKVQISALRKVLLKDPETARSLRTIAGRGYRFLAASEADRSADPSGRTEIRTPERSSLMEVPALSTDGTGAMPLLPPSKPSIAVLPFTNMSGDPEQEYFADGIVEDIITALARFPSLFVIARNSSFAFKGRPVHIRQVGRELGVRYVLEGSVRKAGNRVRITGQLVQVDTSAHIWADHYDGELQDIFALQDEMTASIVGALLPSLQRAEIERARSKPPENLDAYDRYLRALAAFYTLTREGSDHALRLLDQAIATNPHHVAALLLVENCWAVRAAQGWSPLAEALEKTVHYARLAVEVEPDNADALAILARRTCMISHDYAGAISLAERAVSINPNSAYAWMHSGFAFAFAGEAEQGLLYFQRALRLNPRDPRLHETLAGVALVSIQLGRDAEAIATARKAIQLRPRSSAAWRMLTAALALNGRLDEARAALRRVLELDPTCSLRTILLRFGHSEKGRARFFDGLRRAGMPET